jgi:sec-independent protein translocase protein TatC
LALFIGFVPGWIFAKDIYKILARPVTQYLPAGTKLAFTGLTAPFMLYMKVAFLASLFVMSPFVFLQLWYFIAPGLYQKEKKYVVPFVLMTTFFFALGAVFGYFIVFPWACRFFLQLGRDFQPVIKVDEYFGFALRVLLGIAVVFELPTLIFFLAKMGLVNHRMLRRQRKYAILIISIVAALLTPPDVLSMALLGIPLWILYEISVWVTFFVKKEKAPTEDVSCSS